MITASYFDGQTARRHPVELRPGDGALMVMGGALAKEYAYRDVTLAEPFAHASTMLHFADGASCEVDEGHGPALAEALGYRKSAVVRWQERWPAALLALVLLLASGAAIVKWGLPAAAERIAAALPPSLDQRLGESALRGLEGHLVGPSSLSEQRIAQVGAILQSVRPARTRMPIRLLVRNSPRLGINALALPDGAIIVTDGMIQYILGKAEEFDAQQQAQLAGVLAHEIGHIEQRHSVRVLARSSLTAAASAALFGDFSVVAAGVPAVVLNTQYSREMESAADDYAMALLRAKGISAAPLADLFDSLDEVDKGDPSHNVPKWISQTLTYVASHPASAERSERLRRGAR